MSEIKFPLIFTCSGLFTKILSIRVAELFRTRVGLSIVGMRKQLYRDNEKSLLYRGVSDLSKSMLKSPKIQTCFPVVMNFSIVSSK